MAVGPVRQPHALTGGIHMSGLKTHARTPVRPSAEGVLHLYAFDVAASHGPISPLGLLHCGLSGPVAQCHYSFSFSVTFPKIPQN